MVAMAIQEVVPPNQSAVGWSGGMAQRCRRPAVESADTITFRLAATPGDRLAAFRLAYDKYLSQGMLRPNWHRLRVTEFHLLDTTAVFLAERNRRVIGTATLIADSRLGLPLDAVHPELTGAARARGFHVGEASSLAIRSPSRLPDLPVFVGLTRLMAQYARARGIRQVFVACIPQHARFYCRFLGFEQVGPVRPFPTVCDTLGVACRLDFDRIDHCRPDCYDRYFSDPIPAAALVNSPMSDRERGIYSRVMEHSRRQDRRTA